MVYERSMCFASHFSVAQLKQLVVALQILEVMHKEERDRF